MSDYYRDDSLYERTESPERPALHREEPIVVPKDPSVPEASPTQTIVHDGIQKVVGTLHYVKSNVTNEASRVVEKVKYWTPQQQLALGGLVVGTVLCVMYFRSWRTVERTKRWFRRSIAGLNRITERF